MFLTENNKSADLDRSINQSINQSINDQSINLFMSIRGMGLPPIEYVNCFNFVCFYFEYLVLSLTLLSLLRIELWLWLSFLGKGKF